VVSNKVVLFLSRSSLYSLRTSPRGHISLATQPGIALGLPPFLSLRPLCPTLFLHVISEGKLLYHLPSFAVGWAHPSTPQLLMMVVQETLHGSNRELFVPPSALPRFYHTLCPALLHFIEKYPLKHLLQL
jgi:hypothetical protein